MIRPLLFFTLFIGCAFAATAQNILTSEQAVQSALANQQNLKAAQLSVTQQQQLAKGAAGMENPQVILELSPYEPLIVGLQQNISLPQVYRARRALQNDQVLLAQLQLKGSAYDLKRAVRLSYLQLQYLAERERLLAFQDSVYTAIKRSAGRFFEAGQVNKLEELNASVQADRIHNDLLRVRFELAGEREILRFYTGYQDSLRLESIQTYTFAGTVDTIAGNPRLQVLQQQIAIEQRELQVARTALLPEFYAGPLFPTTKDAERPIGFQAGVTIPIWRKQNRSQIAAGQISVDIAQAQRSLEAQRLHARYRQAVAAVNREAQSLRYFNNTALEQAQAIIETSQRLFQAGQLNYIESLRNLSTAFSIQTAHLEAHRAYNEAVIEVNYLNGTL